MSSIKNESLQRYELAGITPRLAPWVAERSPAAETHRPPALLALAMAASILAPSGTSSTSELHPSTLLLPLGNSITFNGGQGEAC